MTGDATTTRRRVQVTAQTAESSEGVDNVDARLRAAIRSAQRARSVDVDAPFALIHFSEAGLRLHVVDGRTGHVIDGRSLESITPASIDRLIADHLVDTGRVDAPESEEWRDELLELSRRGRVRLGTSDGTFIMGREHVRLFRVSRRDVDDATRSVMTRVESVRHEMVDGESAASMVLTASHEQWPGLRSGLTQLSRLPVITIDDHELSADVVIGSADDEDAVESMSAVESVPEPRPEPEPEPAPTEVADAGFVTPPDSGHSTGVISDSMEPEQYSHGLIRASLSSVESGDFPATQVASYGGLTGDDAADTGPISLPLSGPAVRPTTTAPPAAQQSTVYEYPQAYQQTGQVELGEHAGQTEPSGHFEQQGGYYEQPGYYDVNTYDAADEQPREQLVVRSQMPDEVQTGPNVTVSGHPTAQPDDASAHYVDVGAQGATAQPGAQRAARWEPTSWELDPVLANPVRRPGRTISLGPINKRVAVSVAGICVAVAIATFTVFAMAGGDDDVQHSARPTGTSKHSPTSTPYANPADLNAARMPVVLYTPPAPPPQVTQRQQAQAPAPRAPARPRGPAPRRSIPNPIPGLPPILLP